MFTFILLKNFQLQLVYDTDKFLNSNRRTESEHHFEMEYGTVKKKFNLFIIQNFYQQVFVWLFFLCVHISNDFSLTKKKNVHIPKMVRLVYWNMFIAVKLLKKDYTQILKNEVWKNNVQRKTLINNKLSIVMSERLKC